MTNEHLIANKYAKALFLIAKEFNKMDLIYDELVVFFDKINSNHGIRQMLLNGWVPKKLKFVFCNAILEDHPVSDIVRKFLYVLIDKKRLFLLKKINMSFKEFLNGYNGVETVEITLAKAMDAEIIEKIKEQLRVNFKSEKLEFNVKFDKRILGGMVIKKGSSMIDFSILSKLYKIERAVGCSTLNLIN
jgi:F-type H+-transporting ATPase subunit delta